MSYAGDQSVNYVRVEGEPVPEPGVVTFADTNDDVADGPKLSDIVEIVEQLPETNAAKVIKDFLNGLQLDEDCEWDEEHEINQEYRIAKLEREILALRAELNRKPGTYYATGWQCPACGKCYPSSQAICLCAYRHPQPYRDDSDSTDWCSPPIVTCHADQGNLPPITGSPSVGPTHQCSCAHHGAING